MSVIVPTFNRIDYLRRALASVEAQTFRDFELLVLDDGSTDGTRECLAGHAAPFPFRWFARDRRERSYLRNTGAREARGAYLAFLDDDDEWLPEKLERQVDFLERNPAVGLVYTRTMVIDRAGAVDRRATALHQRLYDDQLRRGHGYAALAYFCIMFTSAIMIRRALFLEVGGYDERYTLKEDLDLYLRCSLVTRIACVGEQPLVRYRTHPNGSANGLGDARIRVSQAHLQAIANDPARDPRGTARRAFLFNIARYHLYESRNRAALDALRTLARESPAFLLRRHDWPMIGRILLKGTLLGRRENGKPCPCAGPRDLEGTRDGHVERIDPLNVPQGVLSLHQVRYDFARCFCAGKNVLDVACGAGYGAALLAPVAGRMTGLDLDETAIVYAGKHYCYPNMAYVAGNAIRLPFADASFDTVVSFETIEHLADVCRYLGEVRRVLRPGGTYVVSTPRVSRTTYRPANPHHTIEYSVEDFRALLNRYFRPVELYGQVRVQSELHYWLQRVEVFGLRRYLPRKLRRTVNSALGTAPFEEMQLSDQKIVKDETRRAQYMIAVCRR